jgi:hypothetical protein
MSQADHAMRAGAWRKERHAPALDHPERLTKARTDAARGGTLLMAFTDELYDHEVVKAAEASEAEAAAALAAVKS